ncbi:RNA-directed DNA polymerase, eukaryota [Tanacetum coccineum]
MSGGGGEENKKPDTCDEGARIILKVKLLQEATATIQDLVGRVKHLELDEKMYQDCKEFFFWMSSSTQLKKLMHAYCERQSVELNSIAFMFNGLRLRGEQTPDELGMEEGDEIYALRRLTGGGGGDEDEEPNTGDPGALINLKVKGQVNSFLHHFSDSEVVSDTYFGDNADEQGYENEQGQSFNAKEVSKDPFNIYDLLNKTKKVVGTSGSDTSLPYPPGFTPDKSTNVINEKEVSDAAEVRSNSKSDGGNSRILEEVENIDGCFSSEGRNIGVKPKEGGSILEILDEMIKTKIGVEFGYGLLNNLWVITFSEASFSEALVNCQELNAPQLFLLSKCYGVTSHLSLCVGMASVWSWETSTKSGFGLIDVSWNGTHLPWAHPSPSKMSKLDRFLVSDDLISSFPHISAICLDQHLSDHRPILLRECISDFGAIPIPF